MKSEIIYVWIYEHSVFSKCGFNFSPEYTVMVEEDTEEKKFAVNVQYNHVKNVFTNETISQFTAIVGKNGVGKTSLLSYLKQLNCSPLYKDEEQLSRQNNKELYDQDTNIILLRVENQLVLLTNLPESQIRCNDKNIKIVSMFHSNQDISKGIWQRDYLDEITKIYYTNGIYFGANAVTKHLGIQDYVCTPFDNLGIAHTFYDFLDSDEWNQESGMAWLNRNIKEKRASNGYSQFRTIVFLKELYTNQKYKSFIKHFMKSEVALTVTKVNELFDLKYSKYQIERSEAFIAKLKENQNSLWPKLDADHNSVLNLKYNFLFEYFLCSGETIDETKDFDTIFDEVSECVNTPKKMIKDVNLSYFKQALKDISEYEKIVMLADNHNLPNGTISLAKEERFSNRNEANYKEFLRFMSKVFLKSKEGSILLKYLNIHYPGMSSGEYATLEMFSTLYSLPSVHNITGKEENKLKDNIFLLIDEIDLYCHPEWQLKLIKELHQIVTAMYKGKHVQIVLTTHSPLILSDLPRENCIYLNKNESDGKCIVEDSKKHLQSFGRNVFDLLHDGFFLDEMQGNFATEWLNGLITRIQDKNSNTDEIYEDLELVGEPIIKLKLESMLEQRNNNRDYYIRKIEEYTKKLEKINDTNRQ